MGVVIGRQARNTRLVAGTVWPSSIDIDRGGGAFRQRTSSKERWEPPEDFLGTFGLLRVVFVQLAKSHGNQRQHANIRASTKGIRDVTQMAYDGFAGRGRISRAPKPCKLIPTGVEVAKWQRPQRRQLLFGFPCGRPQRPVEVG